MPLKIRVEAMSVCRFRSWACLAVLRRFNRVCAVVLFVDADFGFNRATFPGKIDGLNDFKHYRSQVAFTFCTLL